MNETIKNTLKSLVAEIDKATRVENYLDAKQFLNYTKDRNETINKIVKLKENNQNKINTIIKGL
jgi:hypothetical protein